MKIWKWFLYLTNNEETSRHEEIFDIIFLAINTVALVAGIYMFIANNAAEWIPVLVIEYCWAFDNMRNNRS
jgi:hypothetical protein